MGIDFIPISAFGIGFLFSTGHFNAKTRFETPPELNQSDQSWSISASITSELQFTT